ncbi:biliverdin-producing heme oxygenase [Falsirhodobacter algicola]|uniref:Heme oxygenase n=1 Tax=Falsirhodobacter algicola TaxID=2692330 RepID=A0A8J8SK91_9RHOB|nr:biliverdin-producing heme oxygenase [Falsirhodobacter algicola]QUS35144.1 heme oxygenase [Falsirhodobacter algicola]
MVHHALDMAVGSFDSLDSYHTYLRANHRFRAMIDPALAGVEVDGWRPRTLLPALNADMADLGLPLPEVRPAPPLTGSALLGCLYVTEGAALGGQILCRRAATLGLTTDHGARHLAGDASSWTAFLARLEAAEGYDADAAAEGAILTFEWAQAAFAKEPT